MSYITEINHRQTCGSCEISVEFMSMYFCPMLGEKRPYSAGCALSSPTDTEFVTEHEEYKSMQRVVEELEAKIKELEKP